MYPDDYRIFTIRDTSIIFKSKILGNQRYFGKYGIEADGIFSMMFCHKSNSFMIVPQEGYYWTLRDDSVSSSKSFSVEKLIDMIKNVNVFFEVLKNMDISDILPHEKSYVSRQCHFLVELSINIKNAIKYRKFIKENAKHTKQMGEIFNIESYNFPFRIVSISPVIFTILYKLKKTVIK